MQKNSNIFLGIGISIFAIATVVGVTLLSHVSGGMNMGWGWGNMGMWDNEGSTKVLPLTKDEKIENAKETPIVELHDGDNYTLEITKVKKKIAGKEYVMLAYNGSTPGPTFKVIQGAKVNIKLVNKVLGLETTLHSHGLLIDNKMDGVPEDMSGTQKAVTFGESFEYKLTFPNAGVFWYHPHVTEDVQQELGLYGNYIVEPKNKDYWKPTNREEALIIDDILLTRKGIEAMSDTSTDYTLMERYGNTMMINGSSEYLLKAKKGEVIKMYFTNASNARVYNITIPNTKMKMVGGDVGRYEREKFIDSFVIAPGKRYIVDVFFEREGQYVIQNKTPDKTYLLGKIDVSTEQVTQSFTGEFLLEKENTGSIDEINTFRSEFNKKPDKSIILGTGGKNGLGIGHMMDSEIPEDGIEWDDDMGMIHSMMPSDNAIWKIIDDTTKEENMDIDWQFKKGQKVKIHIFNDPNSPHAMQHPIHFHGQKFLVISDNGTVSNNLVWKDTALVRAGQYVDILLDAQNPGNWMAHCHISEHLSAGMMMHFRVK